MEEHKNNCAVCGAELIYLDCSQDMVCEICGRIYIENVHCANGHYVCDECHSKDTYDIIAGICEYERSRNPIEIMEKLMRKPYFHMHGPEHHLLVGAALLTAYRNSGGRIELSKALDEMKRRAKQVPGGVCGFLGCCGAAVSSGIFISIATGSTPLKNEEWKLSNRMTSEALSRIADIGGPRCCKRNSFIAATAAASFAAENLGVAMELPDEIKCTYSPMNRECIGQRCPYFSENAE